MCRRIASPLCGAWVCDVLACAFVVVCLAAHPVRAADVAQTTSIDGVACEGTEAAAFTSVWQGHFSGGYSRDLGPGRPIVLDWRDETLCFPSRHSCDRYLRVMRHEFHRPEGYFTCLPIR